MNITIIILMQMKLDAIDKYIKNTMHFLKMYMYYTVKAMK